MAYQPVPLTQKTGVPNSIFAPVPVDYDGSGTAAIIAALAALPGYDAEETQTLTNAEGSISWVTNA